MSAVLSHPARRLTDRIVTRGTHLSPPGVPLQPCREGTKQSILLDMLRRDGGATMAELLQALSGGNRPWQESTVRSAFGWDLKLKGYGVRSEFDKKGVERFFIVLPVRVRRVPPHTS